MTKFIKTAAAIGSIAAVFLSPSMVFAASPVTAYMEAQAASQPKIATALGAVHSGQCFARTDDDKGVASVLDELRGDAAAKGANGVVKVRLRQILIQHNPGWECYQASGLAVVFFPT